MNEATQASIEALNAVANSLDGPVTDPKRFERRHTVELPVPDSAAERVAREDKWPDARQRAAQAEYDAKAAKVKATGDTAAWLDAHSPTIDDVLEERHTTHGDFTEDAATAQDLKYVMRRGRNWEDMPPWMREALEQMQTKIARLLAGDFTHLDSWRDLQGYPRLVEKRLK